MSAYAAVIEDLERRRREIDALLAAMRSVDLGQRLAIPEQAQPRRITTTGESTIISRAVECLRESGAMTFMDIVRRIHCVPQSLSAILTAEAKSPQPRIVKLSRGVYGLPEHAANRSEAA